MLGAFDECEVATRERELHAGVDHGVADLYDLAVQSPVRIVQIVGGGLPVAKARAKCVRVPTHGLELGDEHVGAEMMEAPAQEPGQGLTSSS